ncbi:secreted RxLR effector protein 161-like [Primulina tabacum]|uniref:secreted RxLR effector protein 161-like n=1 Tax=Primulina tabacum TaxID=48773 RepID=UPI003F5A0290
MQKVPYESAVGSLMYAQVCTCPDIAYVTGMLGRYLSNPGVKHRKAVKRVLQYLQRTKYYMLIYRRLDQLEIIGYTDSDFAGCQDSMKSRSGYIYLLAGGAISWKSAKQSLIASSTMTAEFVACYEASNHGIWLQNFVMGLRIVDGIERPLRLHCDKRIQSGKFSIEHIGTNSMVADPLTKGLSPKQFHEHTASMGVVSIEKIQF